MNPLVEYVEKEFFDLSERYWSDQMVQSFVIYSATVDTDIHEEITSIDHDDLVETAKGFGLSDHIKELENCHAVYISNAKQVIKRIIREINQDLEGESMDYGINNNDFLMQEHL